MHLFTLNEHGGDRCGYIAALDTTDLTVTFPGEEPIRLTDTEARIFLALMRAKGRPVSKARIIEDVWGGFATSDALAHRVQALRRKVGRERIKTVYGYGYRLDA